jgi:hypothetical protein
MAFSSTPAAVLFVLALGCGGGGPIMETATPPVPTPLPPPSGKLIEVMLWNIAADLPIGYHENKTMFTRAELPAEYTVLAAMPDSGPGVDATYSVAFDVNGQRFSVADVEPYFLTGVRPGVADAWDSGPGTFEIRTTAYEGKGAKGRVMGTAAARFEIMK